MGANRRPGVGNPWDNIKQQGCVVQVFLGSGHFGILKLRLGLGSFPSLRTCMALAQVDLLLVLQLF